MPPSCRQLSTKLLQDTFNSVQNAVRDAMLEVKVFGCSLCSDGWTDMNSHPLINVVAMTAHGHFFQCAHDCSKKVKSGTFSSNLISKQIDKLGAEDCVCVRACKRRTGATSQNTHGTGISNSHIT
jgi:hypothetical protein